MIRSFRIRKLGGNALSQYYVYILASKKNGVLYIGVTNDLVKRVFQHKSCLIEGFSQKYKTKNLVYYAIFQRAYDAIVCEKRLKHWKRQRKIDLIQQHNPEWNDLFSTLR